MQPKAPQQPQPLGNPHPVLRANLLPGRDVQTVARNVIRLMSRGHSRAAAKRQALDLAGYDVTTLPE